ncbi:MAG: extracellular solute-binding protein [Oscillospiraceae bacterium]|nr:extracellular solute-binding protein [Oscillospiraceae bacterium]
MKNAANKMKYWYIFLLASILLLVPAACSTGGGNQSVQMGPSSAEAAALTYATMHPEKVDRGAIDSFNKKHPELQIEVSEYSGEEAYKRLLVEIAAGKTPDIIDLGDLPYQRLVQLGYLEDLWPYIENDPELGREGVIEAPLKSAEVDGKLCAVFSSVTIETLMGPEAIIGNRSHWSLEELMAAFAAMPEDSTILECYRTKADMLRTMLVMSLDSYIDWDTGRCSFDSEPFRAVLEFADRFPLEFENTKEAAERIYEELAWRQQNGRQMLASQIICGLANIVTADIEAGGRAAFVGYPTEDGSTGGFFVPSGPVLAMSASCQHKDAAWEFIRQTILPQYDRSMLEENRTLTDIAINRKEYDLANRTDMEREPVEMPFFAYGMVTVPAPTEEDLRRFDDLVNSIERISIFNDDAIYDIVEESCIPYFTGSKTLDETVSLIQNRVQLYVNENR